MKTMTCYLQYKSKNGNKYFSFVGWLPLNEYEKIIKETKKFIYTTDKLGNKYRYNKTI